MQSTSLLPIVISLGAMILAALPLHAEVRDKVPPVVPIKAEPFSLSEVRLLEGPFQHAQEMDRRYLRSLEPDRLLHNFRVNAGLPSSAQPLGGWEAPDCELRGHFVGHYLSACARMFASTGDDTLKKNAEYVVSELAKCQEKIGNGYLSAYPESFINRVERAEQVWAPWYTLHKIFAGLMDVAELCGDAKALEVARKMGDWAVQRENRLSDTQFQKMLGNEHGGMNETLANLYALTGDKDYLTLSQRFNHHAVLDPLMNDRDILTGLHANTQIPKLIGLAREFELTGDAKYAEGAKFFWNTVTKERSYVIGGNSDGEYFSPKEKLSQFLSPHTTETCNTYNMLKLTRHLFTWNPNAEYADYYERALFNHILASQNPETGMMCYYVPLRPGAAKEFNSPNDSFWCCTGTGVENHSQYGDSIYFHSGDTLYVNLFIASELQWKTKGITVRQETKFPAASSSKLTLNCAKPVHLTLQVRCPGWVQAGFAVTVNGHPVEAKAKPGSYVSIDRKWKSGDTVEITMPMTLHTEAFQDNPHKLAFLYGPIVLCAPSDPHLTAQAIVSEDSRLADRVKPVAGKSLTFTGDAGLFQDCRGDKRSRGNADAVLRHVRGPLCGLLGCLQPGKLAAERG